MTIVPFVPFLKRMSHKQHAKNQAHSPICDICDFFLKKFNMRFSQKQRTKDDSDKMIQKKPG